MKNKVCFVMPSLNGGGAERVVSLLANQLAEMGDDVKIILLKENRIDYSIDSKVKLITEYTEQKQSPLGEIILIRKLMKKDPTCTFVSFLAYQNIYTIAAGLFMKNNVVVSLRNDPNMLACGNKLIQFATKIAFMFAKNIVFQTEDAMKYYCKSVQKRGTIILNPVTAEFPEYSVNDTDPRVVTFCRLEKQKNIGLAIRAFANVQKQAPDYKYIIYGKGEEKNNLEELIQQLNLESCVEIRDFTKNIFEDIKRARIFVLPSNHEGLSNSMIEAMSMGIPSVCTDCPIGGARMVIEDNVNGILVPVNDEEAMTAAIKRLVEDADLRNRISVESKLLKERLALRKICEQWREVLYS